MRTLRIGYLSVADPEDRWSWSGSHYYMLRALRAQGFDVVPLARSLTRQPTFGSRLLRRIGVGPRRDMWAGSPLERAHRWAAALEQEIRRSDCDVFFAPVADAILSFIAIDRPAVYLSDATFRALRRYYPEVAALPETAAAEHDAIEARAIARAARLIYPSAWAARSAVEDYGAPPSQVRVIPLGANVDDVPPAEQALRTRAAVCRLLFIGRDWKRKGGAIAIETARALRAGGIEAELTLVGSAPDGALPDGVTVAGNLDKKKPRDRAALRHLLETAHFLVLPTRADCYSMVSCEANAFGVPAVVTATGGLPTVVEHGRNGFLLDPAVGGEAYASQIAGAWRDAATYEALSRSTRAAYDERLNWTVWGRAMAAEFDAIAAPGSAAARAVRSA